MSSVTEANTSALGKQGEMLFEAMLTACIPSRVFLAGKHKNPVQLVKQVYA